MLIARTLRCWWGDEFGIRITGLKLQNEELLLWIPSRPFIKPRGVVGQRNSPFDIIKGFDETGINAVQLIILRDGCSRLPAT